MVTGPCSILRTNGPYSPMPTKPSGWSGRVCITLQISSGDASISNE